MECNEVCSCLHSRDCCIECGWRKDNKGRMVCGHPKIENDNDINCNVLTYLNNKNYFTLNDWFNNDTSHNCSYSDIEPLLTEKEKKDIMVRMI